MNELVTTYTVHVTTTGSAGSATGSNTTGRINGLLAGIYFDFHASAPATTDTTVALTNPSMTLLTLTNTVTDTYVPVRVQAKGTDGAAITGVFELFPINGVITVSLAQCDALTDAVVAYIMVVNQ